ncbi:permease-like cell division protein FtsX [Chitinophaga sedimenti]|uniref:cell division protein FtsX n=1 Tax=Chitinophaga sedimenti TaxID=2033606 RepID=UPI00200308AE|nr:permease-like cell division protein FtsX [Chitinophaga sedimenti]MCK7559196.1 permease-like cell division protein FtsX [Chitinophaga sedimenti]
MAQPGKSSAKKSKPSYIYSIVGVALVLLMLGVLGLIMINATKLSVYFKESIVLNVIFRDDVPEQQALALRDTLAAQPFTKNIKYISKAQAAEDFKKEFEDFSSVLDYNPLYAIEISPNAAYVNPDSLKIIEQRLTARSNVREIYYQRTLVQQLNENVRKIGLVLTVISIVLAIVVLVLIDNTIRLAMFSNRFLIKTMQMVGATRGFIAKPFDVRSIINGAVSALLAIMGLIAIIYFMETQVPELKNMRDFFLLGVLFVGLIIPGIGISFLSTHRSVMKYLKLRLDDLY